MGSDILFDVAAFLLQHRKNDEFFEPRSRELIDLFRRRKQHHTGIEEMRKWKVDDVRRIEIHNQKLAATSRHGTRRVYEYEHEAEKRSHFFLSHRYYFCLLLILPIFPFSTASAFAFG